MDVTSVGWGCENMAAHGRSGEKWQSALSEHTVFAELRHKDGDGQASRHSAAQLRSLICSLDGDLLVWNSERKCFHIIRLAGVGANAAPETGQIFLCKNIPLFDVTQVLLSPARHHVALIGSKGLMVLEVPERWGKNSEFEGGEKVVNCRTIPFAERMLSSSTSLVLKQAIWYPSETDEAHLILLTSDNIIRIYSLQDHLKPIKVIPLSNSEEETSFIHMGRSYKASLGETAVACDFGPLVTYPKGHGPHSKEETAYPLYILYENGETFLIYISLHSSKNIGKLVGPLPMHPAAEDNYGYDACAVLCLPCVPSILVIATESGLLYHCVVLEAEEDDEQTSNKSWSSSDIDPVPSLYVCECVELELALKITATEDEGPMDSDFSCPIRLHRDTVCPSRYHCTHMAGVHSVGLTWFENLKTFLAASDEDIDSFQELATEQKCLVEHILCTKPLPCRLPAPIQGFWIISDLALGTAMICVTSEFECITRPLQTTICQPSPLLLCSQVDQSVLETSHVLADVKGSFESHIRGILSRNSANPLLLNAANKDASPPPEECLQLLSRAIQVFREEYALKEDLAREEIQRRVKLLKVQKEKQMEDLQRCKKERSALKETAESLAEKYEEAKDKQEALINRMKVVLHNFHTQLCVLSDSERDMKKELQNMSQQLHQLGNAIKQIKMKNNYQEKQIEKINSPRVSNLTLNNDQKKTIQTVLKEEGEHIQDMVKQINTIRSHVNF